MTTIPRVVPDVRSSDRARSEQFYIDILGFERCMDEGDMVMFCSPSHDWVQVTLNGDGVALPPGFFVDVATPEAVARLHDDATDRGYRIIEALDDKPWGIRRFSLLDPSGTRVTVLAHAEPTPRHDGEDPNHPVQIVRAIPTVRSRDRGPCLAFYVDYLGLEVCMDMEHMVMFCSRSHSRVQVVLTDDLALPPGFDLDVGNPARVDLVHQQALHGDFHVVVPPVDVDGMIRSCNILDPNGVGVNVIAHLAERHQTPATTAQ